jgi:hypothetical protein
MKSGFLYKNIFVLAVLIILTTVGKTTNAQNQEYKRFLGKWVTGPTRENYLHVDEDYIQIYFYIEDLDGILYMRMESRDADAFNMPADEATTSGEKIKAYFEPLNAVFKGEINKANNHIIGTLSFLGKTFPLSCVKIIQE